jgi:hypothetical protein
MELNSTNGAILQQPVKYEFTDPASLTLGSARAQKMHYINGALLITGNCFVDGITSDQLLFSYDIPVASSLISGSNSFNSYSRELVPLGSQKPVTGYWAPENSIYQEDNLSIVGIYNNNNSTFGYTLIQVNDFANDPGCLETGSVELSTFHTDFREREAYLDYCNRPEFSAECPDDDPAYTQECPPFKQAIMQLGDELYNTESLWHFKGIDAQGIRAVLVSENEALYQMAVYDIMGRKIHSSSYNVIDGQREVYLEFNAKAEMYIIRVSNGFQTETIKVVGNR